MLQVSERLPFADIDAAIEQMRQLRDMGVRLAVANFGEGFASLTYLRTLPIDVVKIAPSFVAGVCDGGEATALVSATLELASIMRLEPIATGIQTQAQAEALHAMGCELGEGPLFPDVPRRTPAATEPQESPTTEPYEPPLSIEPVLGWRVWRLHEADRRFLLRSLTRPDTWPLGEPIRAVCSSNLHGGRVPGESCSCGIYAASTPEGLAASGVFSTAASVVGAIAMWGTAVEHDRGARSEWAYPSRLRLVCATCLNQGRGAVVPSVVVGSGPCEALCVRHAIGRKGPRAKTTDVQAALLSSYAVDLMPLERVSTPLRVSRPKRDPRDVLEQVLEVVLMVLGGLMNAFMVFWTIAGFLTLAYWIVALIVDRVLLGN